MGLIGFTRLATGGDPVVAPISEHIRRARPQSVPQRLLTDLQPDGFNIGFNDGLAAGQAVAHAHVHIIPRRKGDVSDPGGYPLDHRRKRALLEIGVEISGMQPSSDEQIRFLVNLQRLLDEGLFVASYKFALLLALADLSLFSARCTWSTASPRCLAM